MLNWPEYVKLLVGLIAIVRPLGAVPVYLSLVEGFSDEEKRRVRLAAVLVFIVILLLFTFLGDAILRLFAINVDSLRVAGGILLLLLALDMMRAPAGPPEAKDTYDTPLAKSSVGIVPLAIPLLAGPGAISTIIVYAHSQTSLRHLLLVSLSIFTVAGLVSLSLRLAPLFARLAGSTGMMVFNRIMGLVLGAIAVEFILNGLAAHVAGITP